MPLQRHSQVRLHFLTPPCPGAQRVLPAQRQPWRRSRSVRCRGLLNNSLVELSVGVAIVAGLGYSALPLVTGRARVRNVDREDKAEDLDEVEGEEVKWGVMTVISFIPLFNWLAWVFAALEDPARARLYYLFAVAYALPSLRNGFSLDALSVACLLLGVAHVQLERVAQTEAVGLDLPAAASARAPARGNSLADASRAFRDAVGGGGRVEQPGEAAAKAAQEERDRAEAEATAAEHEREQLRLWDARLKDRERQQEDA